MSTGTSLPHPSTGHPQELNDGQPISHSLPFSSDSRSNLFPGESDAGTPQAGLPSYWLSSRTTGSSLSENRTAGSRLAGLFLGWRLLLFGSWLNVLLVLSPISWVLSITVPESHGLIFTFCILSLIPLVKLHDLSTRELALRIGGSKTGLINASMSNIVEMVVAISALRKCELRVVQSSLIGSMLSKLLLVLGLCFFAGGMRFSEQGFDATATQVHSSLLIISVGAVLLPAAYHFALDDDARIIPDRQTDNILRMSHGVSIVLLFIYAGYLLFQLWSHSHLYGDHHNKKSKRLSVVVPITTPFMKGREKMSGSTANLQPDADSSALSDLCPPRRPYVPSRSSSGSLSRATDNGVSAESTVRLVTDDRGGYAMARTETGLSRYSTASTVIGQEEKEEISNGEQSSTDETGSVVREPRVSWMLTILVLVVVTIAASISADWLVESMDGISGTISKEWVALILLPAVTSIAECITAVNVSVKDQLSFSISVAVGSTIQTALFVIPFMITLAWAMGKPLSLLMDPFESLVLYISVQTMSYVVADGKSNWLEGMILVCLYIIIAVSFWFYPGSSLPASAASCVASA